MKKYCYFTPPQLISNDVPTPSLEDFYRNLTPPEITLAEANAFNFDHPDAFDWRLLEDTLVSILNGEVAHVPKWDFKTHQRSDKVQMLERPDAVVLEGILVLYKKRIRDSLDMKVCHRPLLFTFSRRALAPILDLC